MKRSHIMGFFGASALLLTSVGLAMSDDGREKADAASRATGITMEEAIKTATAQFPGQVLEAELEDEEGLAVYEVEVVTAAGETLELEIDAQSGRILNSGQDDHGGGRREASDKHDRNP